MAAPMKISVREARRVQPRQRISGAAVAGLKPAGMAPADVGANVGAGEVAQRLCVHSRQSACRLGRSPLLRRLGRGLSLGDPSLRCRVGRHRPDHLVLVLAVLQHRYVLSSAFGPGSWKPSGSGHG
jgi:hypothetical protein